jgi:hypothetical protein
MTTTAWVILIVAIAALGVAAWMYLRTQQTKRLRSRFGPEYDRAVDELGNARKAEDELARREKRVQKFQIRALNRDECDRFAEAWRIEQERFVDDPRSAVARADDLVREAMRARGYPMSEFEQSAADLSVEHPRVVENYRAAHDIAVKDARGQADTEDLRRAMKHYRSLFEDLLDRHVTHHHEEVRR